VARARPPGSLDEEPKTSVEVEGGGRLGGRETFGTGADDFLPDLFFLFFLGGDGTGLDSGDDGWSS
jgi:hypothetical protein